MRRLFLILSILAMLLAACGSGAVFPTATRTAEEVVTALATGTPSPLPLPSFTPSTTPSPSCTSAPLPTGRRTLRYVTAAPSLTPTITPTPDTIVQCLDIKGKVPLESVATSGTIVIDPQDSHRYLLDLQSGKQSELPLTVRDAFLLYGYEVSPDGNFLAYVEPNKDQVSDTLWVVTADGQVQTTMPFEKEWGWWRWLDNQQLEVYWNSAPEKGTVVILNPFTGEKKTITPSFPNTYNDPFNPPYWMVLYSPDLERVLYLSNGDSTYRSGAVIWDVLVGKALWQLSGPDTYQTLPAWSPRGDQVALVIGGKLYRINRTGQAIEIPNINMESIRYYSWSPDGNHIIFWASAPPWETERLFILDTQTNRVSDYCIDGTIPHGRPPLWSPDSQQVLVDATIKKSDGSLTGLTVLIDISQGTAFEILMNHDDYPLAWMRSVP